MDPVAVNSAHELRCWDVLEEHLTLGASELQAFEDALLAFNYVFEEVARRPAERWTAHLDALLTGGPIVMERLIVPLLDEPDCEDPSKLTLACLLALRANRWELLTRALWSEDVEVQSAAVRACALGGDDRFDQWIVSAFAQAQNPTHRTVVLRLAAERRVALPSVVESLRSEHSSEAAAAAAAALWSDPQHHLPCLGPLLSDPSPLRRNPALLTALHWGSAPAYQRCRELASSRDTCDWQALLVLALFGDAKDHGYLAQALGWPEHRPLAVRALGFSGNLHAVDLLMPLLGSPDENEARLVGEALALLTGLELADESLWLTDDSADDDLVWDGGAPSAEDDLVDPNLPLLEPARVNEWWSTRSSAFDPSQRHLRGDTKLAEALVQALRCGPMRDRDALALSLSVRSGGRLHVAPRAAIQAQRQQLSACAGAAARDLPVRFSSW